MRGDFKSVSIRCPFSHQKTIHANNVQTMKDRKGSVFVDQSMRTHRGIHRQM